ncbi:hypothetical protein BDN71DRAFT_1512976 [Pleurotus eryngii]|uniref:Protein kinase domain-containing protein n=1 Tax=Pleurotus eryngii TaxID=5323 RepID=A0A9P5ZJI2_PLEER|nr:hypothetical protein BDN71DRAFT_1512976 [Pleurotus eryngii]
MTSLRLGPGPSPWDSPDRKLPTGELTRYDVQSSPPQSYSINNLELLVDDTGTAVYRGSLKLPDSPELEKVVVKTDFFAETLRQSAFQHEVDMYELHLSSLQGLSIPYCYGLFQHKGEGDKVSSFLVLEDCGDRIKDVSSLANSFKYGYIFHLVNDVYSVFAGRLKALDALYEIHCAGYTHGDLSLHNITNRDGEPFFIDLETAEPHKCEMTERIIVGEERRRIECDEIDICCMLLEIWADVDVKVKDLFVFRRAYLRRENIDFLLSLLIHRNRNTEVFRPFVEQLVEKIEAEREYYRNVPPEKRLILPPAPK